MVKTLSPEAQTIIQNYLHLPFPGRNISCPYYNNRRHAIRGALRVLIGKGSVDDIMDETMILSLKHKIDLGVLTDEQLKQFLVDHHVGIDCSALAYYILDAELRAKKLGGIKRHLSFPTTVNPLRVLLRNLRTVENTSVDVLCVPKTSVEVPLSAVQPGDMIIMKQTGRDHTMNHVLVVHAVEYDDASLPTSISYTHTLQWTTDGKYHHGVRQGRIVLTDLTRSLLEQSWEEQQKTGDSNETLQHAKLAQELTIKRLHALQTSTFVLPLSSDPIVAK